MHKSISTLLYALALATPVTALANVDPFLAEAAQSDARAALKSTHALVCSDLRGNLEAFSNSRGADAHRFGVDSIEKGTHRNAEQGLMAGAGR